MKKLAEKPAAADTQVKDASVGVAKGKEKVGDPVAPNSATNSAPNSGRLPSWLPATPGQSFEAVPRGALMRQGDTTSLIPHAPTGAYLQ